MDISIRCKCGAIQGQVTDLNQGCVRHVICYCGDCQCFARFLGDATELLDKSGGTDVVPVYPSQIKFTEGVENLKAVKLSSDGMIRWYAGCCRSPVGNSVSPKIPFFGLIGSFIDFSEAQSNADTAFGPPSAKIHGKDATSAPPPGTRHGVSLKFLTDTIKFLVVGVIKRKNQPSPFFDQKGRPFSKPAAIADHEYENLRYGSTGRLIR